MELIEGQLYWVLTDRSHSLCVGESEYDDLQYLVLSHTTHRMDDGKKWWFENPLEDMGYTILDEWSIDQFIFKSQDEYLRYWVTHLDNINDMRGTVDRPAYYFDDFMKEKIKESQERSPELWI